MGRIQLGKELNVQARTGLTSRLRQLMAQGEGSALDKYTVGSVSLTGEKEDRGSTN